MRVTEQSSADCQSAVSPIVNRRAKAESKHARIGNEPWRSGVSAERRWPLFSQVAALCRDAATGARFVESLLACCNAYWHPEFGRTDLQVRPTKFKVGLCPLLVLATLGNFILIAVAGEPIPQRLDFPTRILPILTKAGCNAGACHGAAVGQGGFKLSLLGYDPEKDYQTITRELAGRRIDLDSPAASLFLRKPTRQLDHEGGRRIARNSEAYRTIERWIASGVPYGPPGLRVAAIEVTPKDSLLPNTNQSVPLKVEAILSNGTREDVTSLALYTSNDDGMAEVDATGQVTTRDRGLTSIMVRYSGQVAAARLGVPFSDVDFVGVSFPAQNFIDEKVFAELRRLRIPPSALSDDAEFLRRVYLDVIGCLPTPDEVRAFLNEPASPQKRQCVIDGLLKREEFVDFWTMKFADLLLISGKRGSESATLTYQTWLRGQIARDVPFDKLAREFLLAAGDIKQVGPANFYALAADPRDLGEHFSTMFLGTQIACARCHAHPYAKWTQEDYYRFAAYFARVSREGDLVRVSERGEVAYPKTGQNLLPEPLGAAAPALAPAADRRQGLAAWLTAPENTLPAQALVNRVWKHLLGRGLVEPVDDLRPTNPAPNPALWEALAEDFAAGGFDLRRLIRTIVSSRTYQLSSRANDINRRDDRLFSRAYLKPLAAQVLADAIARATGVPEEYAGHPPGTRAVQLVGSQTASYALDVFGRCSRERNCETSGTSGGGLAQTLHLINGSTVNHKLREGVLKEWLASARSNQELIDELYLRTLSRPATKEERDHWQSELAKSGQRAEFLEDLLWALLNSREFALNH